VRSIIRRLSILVAMLSMSASASAASRVWTGAVNALWSVGGNWSGGVPPVSGDTLEFPAGSPSATTNDLIGLTLQQVVVGGGHVISGNAITLLNGGFGTTCCGTVTWNVPTTLGGSLTFITDGGSFLVLQNSIDLNGNTLTLDSNTATFAGSLTGTGNFVANGSVASGYSLSFTGTSTFTGTFTLSPGSVMNVSGTIANSTLSSLNGLLSGNGTIPDTTLTRGAIDFPAILKTGALFLDEGLVRVNIAGTTPGSGYSQIKTTGTVTLNNPELDVFLPGAVPAAGQTFTILDNDGADPVVGTFAGLPEGGLYSVASVLFKISYVGGTGNDVVLTVLRAPKAWTGAVNALWSVGGNWNDGVPPVSGDTLEFPAGTPSATTNDLTGLTLQQVSAVGHVITGNPITLLGGGMAGSGLTWDVPTTLGDSLSFVTNDSMILPNNIDLNGHTLTLDQGFFDLSGSLTGSGNVVVSGSGANLTSSTFTGTFTVGSFAVLNVGTIVNSTLSSLNGTINGGTIPDTTLTQATLSPGGNSPGILSTGSLFMDGGFLAIQIAGTTPGSGYDQVRTIGTVTLVNNPALQLSFPGAFPVAGQTFTIIDNDGTDPVAGTFGGLPEGATFPFGAAAFRISYTGGTGNDVVLTAVTPTTTTLSTSNTPVLAGESFTVAVHVASTATGIPTGNVTLTIDGAPGPGGTLNASGTAMITVVAGSAGSHHIAANYAGDTNFAASAGAYDQLVLANASVPALDSLVLALLFLALAAIAVCRMGS
jgi:hypothetical protein